MPERKVIDIHIHPRYDSENGMEEYVNSMDRFGVEVALCHGMVPGYGRPDVNEAVFADAERFPGRVYASPQLDMRHPVTAQIDEVERFADRGAVCIKLFPNIGFDPSDEHLEPVWAKVEERGLMCLSHCGWLMPNRHDPTMRIHGLTARPLHFEVPARRHPGVNFIFAHFGGGYNYLETITLLTRLPNCYADVARGWGVWVWEQRMPGLTCLDLSKVLYGSDSLGERYGESIEFWIETLQDMGYDEAAIENFLYNNSAKLLGLAEDGEG